MILAGQSCRAFIAGRLNAEAVSWSRGLFHVKQPYLAGPLDGGVSRETTAHVWNEEILLAYTKIPEDHVQDILDIDAAEQAAQAIGRHPQILRGELLALGHDRNAALQRSRRLLQQLSLALAPD